MKTTMIFLIPLICGNLLQTAQAGEIVVSPGNDLNEILNNTNGGDTVLIMPGTYKSITLSGKKSTLPTKLVTVI